MAVTSFQRTLFIFDPTLVFDKTERQPRACDKELMRNREKVENLPEEDKQNIKKIVSALLVKHSVELAVR
jgi:hypothetical protein